MSLGFWVKSSSRVELNSKNPPSTGLWIKSTPPLNVCFPKVLDTSSLNCHLRWNDCCGTLPLVPNEASGKVMSGAWMWLEMRLFQYWNPAVKVLIKVGESCEVKVKLAICRWLVVKLPAVRSCVPSAWSLRLSLACEL